MWFSSSTDPKDSSACDTIIVYGYVMLLGLALIGLPFSNRTLERQRRERERKREKRERREREKARERKREKRKREKERKIDRQTEREREREREKERENERENRQASLSVCSNQFQRCKYITTRPLKICKNILAPPDQFLPFSLQALPLGFSTSCYPCSWSR